MNQPPITPDEMRCQTCHQGALAGERFCGLCGGTVAPVAPKSHIEVVVCISCGNQLGLPSLFCGFCGASQAGTSLPLPGLAQPAETPDTPPAAAAKPVKTAEIPTREARSELGASPRPSHTYRSRRPESRHPSKRVIAPIVGVIATGLALAVFVFFDRGPGENRLTERSHGPGLALAQINGDVIVAALSSMVDQSPPVGARVITVNQREVQGMLPLAVEALLLGAESTTVDIEASLNGTTRQRFTLTRSVPVDQNPVMPARVVKVDAIIRAGPRGSADIAHMAQAGDCFYAWSRPYDGGWLMLFEPSQRVVAGYIPASLVNAVPSC